MPFVLAGARSAHHLLATLLLAALAGAAGEASAHGARASSSSAGRRHRRALARRGRHAAALLLARLQWTDPVKPLSFRARILADRSRTLVYEGAGGRVEDGRADVSSSAR